ncbi:MAG: hypothetical protein ACI867_001639 [Glaciecola sp.]|jgi:hypothetical protein
MRSSQPVVVALLASLSIVAATGPDGAHLDSSDSPLHVHAGEVELGAVGVIGDATVQAVDWQTPAIVCDGPRPTDGPSAPASCAGIEPFQYTFVVQDTEADWLRLDWDQPLRQDEFQMQLLSPDGELIETATANSYSRGIRYDFPYAGTWGVDLLPLRTNGTAVRLRVGLGDDRDVAQLAGPGGELLPNLRVTPPFEFGFAAPFNPANSTFLAGDDQNPGIEAGGQQPVSCTSDEVQEAADATRTTPHPLLRCLRFTAGPHNAGLGHFDLRFPTLSRAQSDRDRVLEMTQMVHHADGSLTERNAGTYEFHATHGHYHYTDILYYELFAVGPGQPDAGHPNQGDLRRVGLGNKSGFCPADQGYAEWSSYWQAPQGQLPAMQPGSCLVTGLGNGSMGLTAGWGDFYRWQRPGQYVDFTLQPDGDYVVRTTVDILDQVLESSETDNASYAYLRITGNVIEVLERGRGSDPWDPAKVVVDDNRS